MRVEGSNAGRVNGILWKMSEELMSKNVELNEISSTD
jgi:hypothetical protein